MKIISVLTFTIFSLLSYAQDETNTLIYNAFDIEDNDDYSSFAMLDSVVNNYNVFFIGENHQFRVSNSLQELKMLKYLHKTAGVRNLCLEFGYSRGYLVNEYIQTGDSTILQALDNFTYEEYTNFYKELYEFNKDLPEDQKITIHGIDLERSFLTSVRLMSMQLPAEDDKKVPEEIALTIETIISLDGYNTSIWEKYKKDEEEDLKQNTTLYFGRNYNQFNQLKTVTGIIENFEENDSIYESYLGENYGIFNRIMEGLILEEERKYYNRKQMIQAKILREKFMYEKFLELVEILPGEKFFSEFGRCHTSTQLLDEWCNFYHFKSLATRIQNSENEHLNGKVMSIGAYYPKGEYSNKNFTYSNLGEINKVLKDEEISLVYVNSDTIYFNDVLQSFNFLIVNNKSLYDEFEDVKKKEVSTGWRKKGYKNDYWHFDALYGFNSFKLNDLNSQFSQYGLSDLPNIQTTYGGALTAYISYNAYTRFSYLMTDTYVGNIGDTASLSLSSNQFMWHTGGNLSDLEIFSIAPNFGIGYQQMNLEITDWYNNVPLASGDFFQTINTAENDLNYKNGAILLDLAMDARINIKFLSLGFFTGYQMDLSSKRWRSEGLIVDESPKTSFSGWHAHASVSIYLHNNYQ